jgi:hypothetical protein
MNSVARLLDTPENVRFFFRDVLDIDVSNKKIFKEWENIINNISTYEISNERYVKPQNSTMISPTYRSGTYSDDNKRWALRKKIVAELFEKTRLSDDDKIKMGKGGAKPLTEVKYDKFACIIIGPPASGKSTIASEIADEFGAYILDSDFAKRKFPEYTTIASGASLLHEESLAMIEPKKNLPDEFQTLFQLCVPKGTNIVIPKIGNEYQSIYWLKFPLLSERAEQMFGERENWFSKKIFKPYLNEQQMEFNYDKNLYYFAVSFLWRILLIELEHNKETKNTWYYNDLIDTERKWKVFLKGYPTPLTDRIYLQFTDRVKDHNLPFEGVDYYFTRALDATIIKNDTTKNFLGVYGKFMRFIFWGIIKGGDENELAALHINPTGGILKNPQYSFDQDFAEVVYSRIEAFDKEPKASVKQQGIIIEEIRKDRKAFFNSDAGQSMLNDRRMKKKFKL